jgi:outer membrane protein assembly factor BamE (lipoprotein component of BamABCDE complex)
MKFKHLAILALTFTFLLTSCRVYFEAKHNRENLDKLKIGMSRVEAIAVMGEPVKDQVYCKPNVLFYYTDTKWSDGNITSDECTPLVFEKDKLIGIGADFYKDYMQRDWK